MMLTASVEVCAEFFAGISLHDHVQQVQQLVTENHTSFPTRAAQPARVARAVHIAQHFGPLRTATTNVLQEVLWNDFRVVVDHQQKLGLHWCTDSHEKYELHEANAVLLLWRLPDP